jgi:hypothetical protein
MKLRGMRSTTFVIFAVKNDGMSARNKGRSPSNGDLLLLRRSSIGSFVEIDFFIRILFQVYFGFA